MTVHQMSAEVLWTKLVDDSDFRARLAFEMGDEDVVVVFRDLSFTANIPSLPSPVRVFQNNTVSWVGRDCVLTTRYVIGSPPSRFRIKSLRSITPLTDSTCRSATTVELGAAPPELLAFIHRRHEIEDALLDGDRPIAYGRALAAVRDDVADIERGLEAQAAVDLAVAASVGRLGALRRSVGDVADTVVGAMEERAQAMRELAERVEGMRAAAEAVGTRLARADGEVEPSEVLSVALAVVPLVIGVATCLVGWMR
jgi:hypothetical protein